MIEIVTQLGDELANRRPDVPGANSPYALLHHCLGVMEYWAGYVRRRRRIGARPGRRVPGDRQRARARRPRAPCQQQLRTDVAGLEPFAPPRGAPGPEDADYPPARTQGGVLIHVYEELAQHRGQMEGCRDVLLAPWAQLA